MVVAFGRLASQVKPFDPMELAFHLRADELAIDAVVAQDLVHQYPFGSGLLVMTNLWRQPDGSLLAAAKGLQDEAEVFTSNKLDQPNRLKLMSQEAMNALGAIPQNKDTKVVNDKIQARLKKARITL